MSWPHQIYLCPHCYIIHILVPSLIQIPEPRFKILTNSECQTMCALQKIGSNRAKRGQRVQDQKGGGRTLRGPKPVCDVKITGLDTQLSWEIPVIFGRIALAIPVYELAMSLSVCPSVRPFVCLSTFWLNFWFKQNLSYGYRYMFATWCVAYQ